MTESFFSELQDKSNSFYKEYEKLMKNNYNNVQNNGNTKNKEEFQQEFIQKHIKKLQEMQKDGKQLSEQDILNYVNSIKNNPDEIDSEGGKIITPEPYCIIKTFNSHNEKVFINITTHKDILPPTEEHILEMNSQLGVRVPLSLSEKKEDFDVNKKPCLVFDVIFSDKVKKLIDEQLEFVVILIAQRIKQRFNIDLKTDSYTRLKNVNYKGSTITTQRVKIKKNIIKEVIEPTLNSNRIMPEKLQEVSNSLITPEGMIYFIMEKINNKYDAINLISFLSKYTKNSKQDIDLFNLNKLTLKSFFTKKTIHGINMEFSNKSNNLTNIQDVIKPFIKNSSYSKNTAGFIVIIHFPMLSKSFGINIKQYLNNTLVVNVPKMYYFEIKLPYSSNDKEKIFSYFDTNSKCLYIIFDNKDFIDEKGKIIINSQVKDSRDKLLNQNLQNNEYKVTDDKDFTHMEVKLDDQYLFDVIV